MATIQLVRCDCCTKEKKEKDQWIDTKGELGLTVGALDLCSHACLHKKIDELLNLKRIGRPRGSRNRKPAPVPEGAAA